jgi:hypothetical protein
LFRPLFTDLVVTDLVVTDLVVTDLVAAFACCQVFRARSAAPAFGMNLVPRVPPRDL